MSDRPRTVAQVLAERGTVVGCCNRHADNQSCGCLMAAVDYVLPVQASAFAERERCARLAREVAKRYPHCKKRRELCNSLANLIMKGESP